MAWEVSSNCRTCGAPIFVLFADPEPPNTAFSCDCRLWGQRLLQVQVQDANQFLRSRGSVADEIINGSIRQHIDGEETYGADD